MKRTKLGEAGKGFTSIIWCSGLARVDVGWVGYGKFWRDRINTHFGEVG